MLLLLRPRALAKLPVCRLSAIGRSDEIPPYRKSFFSKFLHCRQVADPLVRTGAISKLGWDGWPFGAAPGFIPQPEEARSSLPMKGYSLDKSTHAERVELEWD